MKGSSLGKLQHTVCFQPFDVLGRQEYSENKKASDCQRFQRVEWGEINKWDSGKLQASKTILFDTITVDIWKHILSKSYGTIYN